MDESTLQNELRGQIFWKLAQGGVRRQMLSIHDFSPSLEWAAESWDDLDSLLVDMMIWLRDEGLVRYQAATGNAEGGTDFHFCQLTSKGLAFLDAPLGNDSGTVGEARPDATGDFFERIGRLLGGFAGSFTNSL